MIPGTERHNYTEEAIDKERKCGKCTNAVGRGWWRSCDKQLVTVGHYNNVTLAGSCDKFSGVGR